MSSPPYNLYNNSRKVKLYSEKLNTQTIARVFGLFPDNIFLVAKHNGSVELPDDSGKFSLKSYNKYEVCGDALKPSDTSPVTQPFLVTNTSAPPKLKGISIKTKWPAKPPGVLAKKAMEWTKNIEVNQYNNGELKKFSNFPIILTESTATIMHVSKQLACEAFAGNKVILLDNDNLPIPNTTATKGTCTCMLYNYILKCN